MQSNDVTIKIGQLKRRGIGFQQDFRPMPRIWKLEEISMDMAGMNHAEFCERLDQAKRLFGR